MVRISRSKDPYSMDMIIGFDIAALTKKNSNFIEAVLKLDSNYKKEQQAVPPDDRFELNKHASNSNGLYCGSARFWFNEMTNINSVYSYKECVLGAVISIDRSNSTHLETTENGRKKMTRRIIKRCPDLEALIDCLSTPFTATDDNHLIACMVRKGFKSIKDGSDMYYLSFASKFCSYASAILGSTVAYSKYDKVVAQALPVYYQAYCKEIVRKTEFMVDNSIADKYHNRLEVYEKYSETISQIIAAINKSDRLSRDEFDHIIWYGMKGN